MGEQQVQLNGAYYGPPVPPPQKTYRSVGHGRGCCGPCCLLTTLLKLIISIAFTIGVILLIIWLIFRPNKIQVYVESATLTQFNLSTTNNNLNYDLNLNVSIRNPNKRVAFYYDYIEARGFYDGSRFGFDQLPTFYQGHKNTTMLQTSLQGSQIAFGSVSSTFNREKGEGNFYVQVKFYPSIRLKVKFVKIGHFHPKFDCVMKLPVPGSKINGDTFDRTKCDVDIF